MDACGGATIYGLRGLALELQGQIDASCAQARAEGILMERLGLTQSAAVEVLRSAAARDGVNTIHVAARILEHRATVTAAADARDRGGRARATPAPRGTRRSSRPAERRKA